MLRLVAGLAPIATIGFTWATASVPGHVGIAAGAVLWWWSWSTLANAPRDPGPTAIVHRRGRGAI